MIYMVDIVFSISFLPALLLKKKQPKKTKNTLVTQTQGLSAFFFQMNGALN